MSLAHYGRPKIDGELKITTAERRSKMDRWVEPGWRGRPRLLDRQVGGANTNLGRALVWVEAGFQRDVWVGHPDQEVESRCTGQSQQGCVGGAKIRRWQGQLGTYGQGQDGQVGVTTLATWEEKVGVLDGQPGGP